MINKNEKQVVLHYLKNIVKKSLPKRKSDDLLSWVEDNSHNLFGFDLEDIWNTWGRKKYRHGVRIGRHRTNESLKENDENKLKRNINTVRKILAEQNIKPLPKNVKMDTIFKAFNIDRQDRDFLTFLSYAEIMPMLNDFYSNLIDSYNRRAYKLFANIIGSSFSRIEQNLSDSSSLITKGVIEKSYSEDISLSNRFKLILSSPTKNIDNIRRLAMGKPLKATLAPSDFEYIAEEFGNIKTILQTAIKKRTKGVNILLYGIPGTGKTEMAKILAKEINASIYSVSEESKQNDRYERMTDLALMQAVSNGCRNILLLLDEAEDVLYQNPFGRKDMSKLYFNRMLEQNQTPVIWISNDIEDVDPAYIRRFSYALQVKKPDVAALKRVWKNVSQKHKVALDDARMEELSQKYDIAPAIIDTAIRTSILMKNESGIERTIDALQKATLGYSKKKKKEPSCKFSTELLNCDTELSALADSIVKDKITEFSLCLYGAPGTGKSAYARFLADKMGMKVIQKRASDLQSKWVGETEQNIARVFNKAYEERALLVFDEADSFLQDRNKAQQSWEISQVNEMLTQMESHPLPFVCTTNLMKELDKASLRRFTFKVKYDYLKPAQIASAFKHFFGSAPTADLRDLDYLAPGDFEVVANKARIMHITDHMKLAEMLRMEQEVKGEKSQRMGF